MHFGLFRAFFEEGVNIGEPTEVIEVAQRAGLNMDQFLNTYEEESQRDRVLEEHSQAVATYGVRAIPTVIIGEAPPIVGAVPLQEYERLLARMLR
jgi:predicted DsbA family dithiol-disulfide isomerase